MVMSRVSELKGLWGGYERHFLVRWHHFLRELWRLGLAGEVSGADLIFRGFCAIIFLWTNPLNPNPQFSTPRQTPCLQVGDVDGNQGVIEKISDRQWMCPECGSHHDRDINAAINIKRAGLAA